MTTTTTTTAAPPRSPTTTRSLPRRVVGWLRDGAVLLFVTAGVGEVMARMQAPDIELHHAAPTTKGVTLDGAPFDLAAHAGKPIFVNLWATWCAPCRAELPDLAEAARQHPEVQFVGLTMGGSDAAQARTLIAEAGVTYPIVLVPPTVDAAWGVTSFPSSVLLDSDGHVVWRRAGAVDAGDIADVLKQVQ